MIFLDQNRHVMQAKIQEKIQQIIWLWIQNVCTFLKNVISHCPIVKTVTVLYKRTNIHFNTNLLFNRWNKVRQWAVYYTRQFSNFTIFLEKKKNNK